MIESKIVEATESFSKTVGGIARDSEVPGSNTQFFSSFAGGNPTDPDVCEWHKFTHIPQWGGGGERSSECVRRAAAAVLPAAALPGGNFGVSPQLAFLPSSIRLNALLNLSETQNDI